MAQVLHSRPVTPVKVDRLEYLLHGYPASLQEYLVSGFSCGFHIHFMGERHAFESPNLKSALEQPQNSCFQIKQGTRCRSHSGPLF